MNKLIQIASIEDESYQRSGRIYSIEGISPTIVCPNGGGQDEKIMQNERVRRLTPKECWRLMGFDDEDFEKAQKVNSDTQLYKQAWNSIVVDCLCGILSNLLNRTDGQHSDDRFYRQLSLFERSNNV